MQFAVIDPRRLTGHRRTLPDRSRRGHIVETPPHFRAVGQFSESFPQVSDVEAIAYLDA